MIEYLNIGPGRSGSTSFYKICLNIKDINCGKLKEPVDKRWTQTDKKELILDIDSYIDNWDFDPTKKITLIDGSGQLYNAKNIIDFKEYMSNHISSFKFILLVRNPKLYFRSRLYINFLFEMTNDLADYKKFLSIPINDIMSKINYMVDNKYLDSFSYLTILKKISSIFNKDEIFILPIEFFNDYKNDLSEFLNIDFSSVEFPHVLTRSLSYNRQIFLNAFIKQKIFNDENIDCQIKNDFKIIDSEYGSNLYNLYIKE